MPEVLLPPNFIEKETEAQRATGMTLILQDILPLLSQGYQG